MYTSIVTYRFSNNPIWCVLQLYRAPFLQRSCQAVTAEARKMNNLAAVLRRVCTPKASTGKLDVSPEIYRQWKLGGEPRKALMDILIKNGGDKEFTAVQILCSMHTCWSSLFPLYRYICMYNRSPATTLKPLLQELFKKEIKHIQKRSRRSKVNVKSGFYTKKAMKDDLKWSKS